MSTLNIMWQAAVYIACCILVVLSVLEQKASDVLIGFMAFTVLNSQEGIRQWCPDLFKKEKNNG